jgi:predicted Zn-ribbon and HTH transcriptional regulator
MPHDIEKIGGPIRIRHGTSRSDRGSVVIVTTWSIETSSPSATTMTTVKIQESVTTGKTVRTTTRTETTKADRVESVWERALDPGGWLFLRILLAVLAAFFVGAATQRVLLGTYTIKIGPLELGEIALKDVVPAGQKLQQGLQATLQRAKGEEETPHTAVPDLPASQSPAVQLIRLGDEVARRLRSLAEQHGLEADQPLPELITTLAEKNFFNEDAKNGLLAIAKLANQATQGMRVTDDVGVWAREVGSRLLAELDALLSATTTCAKCGHRFSDEELKGEGDERRACPECGATQRKFYRTAQDTLGTTEGVT